MGKVAQYSIVINARKRKYREFLFNYRTTKNICLLIGDNSAVVELNFCPKSEEIDYNLKENTVTKVAIKKAALLHLALYSKPLLINKIVVYKSGINDRKVSNFPNPDSCLICLVESKFGKPLPEAWKTKPFLEGLITLNISTDSRITASIYSFLSAKGSKFEYQRFIYLWTSMNGLYGYYWQQSKDGNGHEASQILNLIKMKQMGQSFPPKSVNVILAKTITPWILENIADDYITDDYFSRDENNEIGGMIRHLLMANGVDLSPYSYLLFGLSYYYRCQMIHADKPLPLFSFGMESELKVIRIINCMLESFLERNLPQEVERIHMLRR